MNENDDFMLTTVDNPYDPFKDWEGWYKWDMINGYDSCGFLARQAATTNHFSDRRNEEEILQAMKDIVRACPGIYKIVYKNKAEKTVDLPEDEKEVPGEGVAN